MYIFLRRDFIFSVGIISFKQIFIILTPILALYRTIMFPDSTVYSKIIYILLLLVYSYLLIVTIWSKNPRFRWFFWSYNICGIDILWYFGSPWYHIPCILSYNIVGISNLRALSRANFLSLISRVLLIIILNHWIPELFNPLHC